MDMLLCLNHSLSLSVLLTTSQGSRLFVVDVKFLPSTKRTYVSYEIDLYIKLPVKINNITNKLLEKLRESEVGWGGEEISNTQEIQVLW